MLGKWTSAGLGEKCHAIKLYTYFLFPPISGTVHNCESILTWWIEFVTICKCNVCKMQCEIDFAGGHFLECWIISQWQDMLWCIFCVSVMFPVQHQSFNTEEPIGRKVVNVTFSQIRTARLGQRHNKEMEKLRDTCFLLRGYWVLI